MPVAEYGVAVAAMSNLVLSLRDSITWWVDMERRIGGETREAEMGRWDTRAGVDETQRRKCEGNGGGEMGRLGAERRRNGGKQPYRPGNLNRERRHNAGARSDKDGLEILVWKKNDR